MMYILDTANTAKIKELIEFFPVAGVTTNPTIISREKKEFFPLIKEIRDIIGSDRMLHIQVTSDEAEDMVKEAEAIRKAVGGNLYIKVPISRQGLKATIELKKRGFNVTETAIFTQQQAMVAASAGADFVAPYVNRLDNIISDGVNVVTEIVEMFRSHNSKCKVLAASFKTAEQVHKICMTGADAVTVNPEILDILIYHPMSLYAIDDFNTDWAGVYGKETILSMAEKNGKN